MLLLGLAIAVLAAIGVAGYRSLRGEIRAIRGVAHDAAAAASTAKRAADAASHTRSK